MSEAILPLNTICMGYLANFLNSWGLPLWQLLSPRSSTFQHYPRVRGWVLRNFPLLNFHRFQPLLENDMEYTRGSPTLPSGTEVFHEELAKTLPLQNPPAKHKDKI